MSIYRIANWQQDFETAETRKLIYLKWVPVPNKHDGLGFKRVACQKNAPELFCAWNLMLQVASKGHRDTERGRLVRDGRGLTDEDLSMMTSYPAKIFAAGLEFFSSPRMGWLELDNQGLASPPVITGERAGITGPSPAEGIEGREGIEHTCAGFLLLPSIEPELDLNEFALEIFAIYPRKEGKADALKAIRDAFKAIVPLELREKVMAYADAVSKWSADEKQYVPWCQKWMNKRRWLDDPATWIKKQAALPTNPRNNGVTTDIAKQSADIVAVVAAMQKGLKK